MNEQIYLNQKNFKEMENKLMKQVLNVSKAIIETFKFKMLYGIKVTDEQNEKTLKHLKEFRSKNWDKKISRNKAYKKYIKLYD